MMQQPMFSTSTIANIQEVLEPPDGQEGSFLDPPDADRQSQAQPELRVRRQGREKLRSGTAYERRRKQDTFTDTSISTSTYTSTTTVTTAIAFPAKGFDTTSASTAITSVTAERHHHNHFTDFTPLNALLVLIPLLLLIATLLRTIRNTAKKHKLKHWHWFRDLAKDFGGYLSPNSNNCSATSSKKSSTLSLNSTTTSTTTSTITITETTKNDGEANGNKREMTTTLTLSLPTLKNAKNHNAQQHIDPGTPRSMVDMSDMDSQGAMSPTADSLRSSTDRKDSHAAHRRVASLHRENTTDPVTNAILQRTGSENLLPKTLREAATAGDQDVVNGVARQNNDLSTRGGAQMQGSVKKKGVSFLSRIMGSKKKNTIEEEDECESPGGDHRTEGMDAAVFSQPIGFTPTFPAPPKYIRVHTHQKPNRDFNQTFLAQELYGSQSPTSSANDVLPPQPAESTTSFVAGPPRGPSRAIWTMKFSNDGRYLAAAGQDAVVRVWQVLSSHADRATHEQGEDAAYDPNAGADGQGVRLNAPVFLSQPIHEYHGHTAEVLSLSWSKNNFLLSSSMDKTVRLWHVTRKECLCCFRHPDFVTSIAFHPKDDRFFLAGSLDSKLRLWSIPDKSVAFCAELPDLITAVNFTPDGRMAIAGCLNGLCLFYETENLKYNTQLHVRSTHGRNAKGSKITGIETAMFPPNDPSGEIKILVTSNDSRVRMYNLRDKMLESKFKGNKNNCSQILASFSDDNKYIISGSEDKKVYIWDVESGDTEKKDKRPLEFFTAHPTTVTAALIAPVKTRQLLAQSGDPLYDLCNPPPVTLVSRSNSITSSRRTTAPPSTAGEDHSHDRDSRMTASSGWISRSQHPDGNIIVTADSAGRIKVFRQDCAAGKRRGDSWDTLSTLSKRLSTGIIRKTSLRDHGSPDRIASWRQSIASTHSLENASIRSRASFATDTGSRRRRSTSPSLKPIPSRMQPSPQPSYHPRNGSVERNSIRSAQSILRKESPVATKVNRSALVISDEEDSVYSSDGESDGEAMRCRNCLSTSFKAKHNRKGEHRLVCIKCNTVQMSQI